MADVYKVALERIRVLQAEVSRLVQANAECGDVIVQFIVQQVEEIRVLKSDIALLEGDALGLEERIDVLEDALHKIRSWSEAYPLSVFPEPDLKKAAELLKAGGQTLDAISAHCMRHVVEGVGRIAKEALKDG